MTSETKPIEAAKQASSEIRYDIGIGIRAPIITGTYRVRDFEIDVSYPTELTFASGRSEQLPVGLSTLFQVRWSDPKDLEQMAEKNHRPALVVHKALGAINELLQAYKLVTICSLDGCGVRTIGMGDTLFHVSYANGYQTGLNIRLKGTAWGVPGRNPEDPSGVTPAAALHIGTPTLPVARRYVRCYELLEHGFHSEAFIVAFSAMDDLVQDMVHAQLQLKGVNSNTERETLVRGIKESRLKIYLGPMLKVLHGKSLAELWPSATSALGWMNSLRNDIAHAGVQADHNSAAIGIFGCIKLLRTLHIAGLMKAEFPADFYRHAKTTAAVTINTPAWVPTFEEACDPTVD